MQSGLACWVESMMVWIVEIFALKHKLIKHLLSTENQAVVAGVQKQCSFSKNFKRLALKTASKIVEFKTK